MMRVFLAIGIAGLSWLTVWALRHWARRLQLLDIPNDRSSHTTPVPRGGGLAIVLISLVAWLTMLAMEPAADWRLFRAFLYSASLIAFVSWIDDLRSISSLLRLAAHTMAAAWTLWELVGMGKLLVPGFTAIHLGGFAWFLGLFWMVGLTNVYNFMDGTDGIAGVQTIVAGIGWIVLGEWSGMRELGMIALFLTASTAGFLIHNWSPARIFMGDVGSAFLGFTFAFLAVVASQADPRLGEAGVLLLAPFLFDATFTLFRRIRKGENILVAHRSHLYQRLVIAGYSHRFVAILYGALALLSLGAAMLLYGGSISGHWFSITTIFLPGFGLWLFVCRSEASKRAAKPA